MNYYRELLQQSSRVEPFRRAIQSVVGPDDRVLEVGAGLGTYSFFAADAGAARVWAVEGAPIIHVAETIAKLNGYAGRVEFLRGWVPDVPIPERATVLIYEDFPSRLIDAPTFRLLGKLRERYLTPDAVFVPGRARLLAVPVHLESSVVQALPPLGGADDVLYGVDWAPSREYVINSVHRVTVPPDSVTQIAPAAPPAGSPGPGSCGRKAAMTPAAQADGSELVALASACSSAENSAHRMP